MNSYGFTDIILLTECPGFPYGESLTHTHKQPKCRKAARRDHGDDCDMSPSNKLLKRELQTRSLQGHLYEKGCLTAASTSQTLVPLQGWTCLSMSV